jgi:hypothetical protein
MARSRNLNSRFDLHVEPRNVGQLYRGHKACGSLVVVLERAFGTGNQIVEKA